MTSLGIQIQQVSFAYAPSQAIVLAGLDLQVAPGEIVALLGSSGCGKSTLLKVIAGLHAPDSGQISMVPEESVQDSVEERLAFVFQDANLLPWRTVFDNVALPLELDRRALQVESAEQGRRSAVKAALQSVQLPEASFRQYPRELSGGMRMRTSIARALVTDPNLLLLDEPFAALDDLLRTRLNELILRLWSDRKRTIVFVTHNIAEATFLSHRIAILASGKIGAIIDNPLTWPRTAEQRTTSEFAAVYATISAKLAEVAA